MGPGSPTVLPNPGFYYTQQGGGRRENDDGRAPASLLDTATACLSSPPHKSMGVMSTMYGVLTVPGQHGACRMITSWYYSQKNQWPATENKAEHSKRGGCIPWRPGLTKSLQTMSRNPPLSSRLRILNCGERASTCSYVRRIVSLPAPSSRKFRFPWCGSTLTPCKPTLIVHDEVGPNDVDTRGENLVQSLALGRGSARSALGAVSSMSRQRSAGCSAWCDFGDIGSVSTRASNSLALHCLVSLGLGGLFRLRTAWPLQHPRTPCAAIKSPPSGLRSMLAASLIKGGVSLLGPDPSHGEHTCNQTATRSCGPSMAQSTVDAILADMQSSCTRAYRPLLLCTDPAAITPLTDMPCLGNRVRWAQVPSAFPCPSAKNPNHPNAKLDPTSSPGSKLIDLLPGCRVCTSFDWIESGRALFCRSTSPRCARDFRGHHDLSFLRGGGRRQHATCGRQLSFHLLCRCNILFGHLAPHTFGGASPSLALDSSGLASRCLP
jgi:hypothetical protein